MAIVVTGAGAVANRLRDLVELAAPQPIVVIQIGISLGAGAAGPVARRAIVGKSAAAERAGKIEQLRGRLDLLQRG